MGVIEELQQLITDAGSGEGTLGRLDTLIVALTPVEGQSDNATGMGDPPIKAKKHVGLLPGEEENAIPDVVASLEKLKSVVDGIRNEKLVIVKEEIKQTQVNNATNKQDILRLLTKLLVLNGSISDFKEDMRSLQSQIKALAAAQAVPEHEKPNRQAENMI